MKRCVLDLIVLVVASFSFAEPTSPAASSDTVFWWAAAGISQERIERLTAGAQSFLPRRDRLQPAVSQKRCCYAQKEGFHQ